VACVAVGSAGPVNAALLAVQMLALSDAELSKKYQEHKETLKRKVAAANDRIHADGL
jgi:5-(carboxyamino)imidazole ribonucleotide mutase